MTERRLPKTASVAEAREGAKLHAPAAARNATVITDLLVSLAPERGKALELASGTGQHIVSYAAHIPQLRWQPSEVDPDRLASIAAYRQEAGLPNVEAPVALNACAPGWGRDHAADLIVLVNLLHLVSAPEARTLVDEAAQALTPGGACIFYGPFSRDGVLTSEGDIRFDASLRDSDPAIGYKSDSAVLAWMTDAGLAPLDPRAMPANNLALIAHKPKPGQPV